MNWLVLFFVHYFFDWVFQSRKIAEAKSKSLKALTQHVLIYSVGLCYLSFFGFSWTWIGINIVAHFIVDFFTSKAATWAFTNNKPLFWKIVGFDQLLHYVILFGTYESLHY